MNTVYDIDDTIYVPAKVERVVKTSDGRVFYRLRTVDGNYQIDADEEKVKKEFVTIPDQNFIVSDGLFGVSYDGGKTLQTYIKDGRIFISEKDLEVK